MFNLGIRWGNIYLFDNHEHNRFVHLPWQLIHIIELWITYMYNVYYSTQFITIVINVFLCKIILLHDIFEMRCVQISVFSLVTSSLWLWQNTVCKVIFAPCNFRRITIANSFAPVLNSPRHRCVLREIIRDIVIRAVLNSLTSRAKRLHVSLLLSFWTFLKTLTGSIDATVYWFGCNTVL